MHPLVQRLARAALRTRALELDLPPTTIGKVTLWPHQVDAVRWLQARIRRYHGALLADPPGLGKTYVALAVAAKLGGHPLVVAPAALRQRWFDAAEETDMRISFVSTERLSAPADYLTHSARFIIIDEAHHLRTRTTRRHQRTAALCANAQVLLLSATPVQNRTRDLESITSLFHLPPNPESAALLRRRLTLRRSLSQINAASHVNTGVAVLPTLRTRTPPRLAIQHERLPAELLAIPSLDDHGPESHALFQLGLLHALRSSDAAARLRIQHRIAATIAIEHATAACIQPTAAVKRAWSCTDGDIQLAMPQLLGFPQSQDADTRIASRAQMQRRSLEALLPQLTGASDKQRAHVLRRLARWSATPVVAFTQFSATADAIYRTLKRETGIAMLTGDSAQICTGIISRSEVLERLLSPKFRTRQDAVRLLITTDVLSEGLSLAGVGTVVHLDLPWTAARLDQRVGRAARVGSPVREVRVLTLGAPLPATTQTAIEKLLARKRRWMTRYVSFSDDETSLITTLVQLRGPRAIAADDTQWLEVESDRVSADLILAIVRWGGRRTLIVMQADQLRAPTETDWRALAAAREGTGESSGRPSRRGADMRRRLRRALLSREANLALSSLVADRQDQRLIRRQQADEQLLQGNRSARAASAATVSIARRHVMTTRAGRMPDLFEDDAPGASGSCRARILAGVLLVPSARCT